MFSNDVDKSVNVEGATCEFMRGGLCKTHKVMGKKIVVSAMKWRKDKSGTFKNMKTQQTKFICKLKSSVPVGPNISTSSKSQRFSDENNVSGDYLGLDRERVSADSLKEKVS